MNGLLGASETVQPTDRDARLAAASGRALAELPETRDLTLRLPDGAELTLPLSARRLLARLLDEMGHGHAVTLVPVHAELTTQEAADMLNVSRPHMVKLLERGELSHRRVGTHRRVRLADLQAYAARLKAQHDEAMQSLADDAPELGLGY